MSEKPGVAKIEVCQVKHGRGRVIPAQLVTKNKEDGQHVKRGRRQNAIGTPNVKLPQADGSRLAALLQQQLRNQIAGDNEKYLNSQISEGTRYVSAHFRRGVRLRQMADHHQKDRKS